jgi:hypothetical protein
MLASLRDNVVSQSTSSNDLQGVYRKKCPRGSLESEVDKLTRNCGQKFEKAKSSDSGMEAQLYERSNFGKNGKPWSILFASCAAV